MSIGPLRKFLVYAMTGIAIFSLAFAPEIGVPPVAFLLVCVALSWFWEPPRIAYERFAMGWTIITLAFFAGTVVAIVAGIVQLLSGILWFVLFLAVSKLFQRERNADYIQAMALSLVVVAASSVFNDGLSFGILFALYVLAATVALTLQHLHVEIEEHHRRSVSQYRADPRIITATLGLSVLVLIGSLAFFFVFPRVGFGFFAQQQREGVMTTGFGENVELGSHGTIRSDATVVMRIRFPQGMHTSPNALYMRGTTMDEFDGRRWSHTSDDRLSFRTEEEIYLLDDPELGGAPDLADLNDSGLAFAEVYLEPLNTAVLFSPGRFRAIRFPAIETGLPHAMFGRRLRAQRGGRVAFRSHSELGLSYQVWAQAPLLNEDAMARARHHDGSSWLAPAIVGWLAENRPDLLDAAPEGYIASPSELRQLARQVQDPELTEDLRIAARYLQLPPDGVSERTQELIASLRQEDDTPLAFAQRLERWLATQLGYTTDLSQPEGPDTDLVDAFLFEWQEGHCEYFATAMVVMLRAAGVPARMVNGFLGSQYNAVGDFYTVRQANAHSWVEAWFPGVGWHRFEPTPASAPSLGSFALVQWFADVGDAARMLWLEWIIDYNAERQISLLRQAFQAVQGQSDAGARSGRANETTLRDIGRWLLHRARALSYAGMLLLVFGFLLHRRARLRIAWGMHDHGLVGAWALLSGVGVWILWPGGVPGALGLGLGPVLVGGGLAWLIRRDLLSDPVGRGVRVRRISNQEVSRWVLQLVSEAERRRGDGDPSRSPAAVLEVLAVDLPEEASSLRALVALYHEVRFGERELSRPERRAWKRTVRRIRRAIRRAPAPGESSAEVSRAGRG